MADEAQEQFELLRKAIAEHDLAGVQSLFARGLVSNQSTGPFQETPLHLATLGTKVAYSEADIANSKAIVDFLLEQPGANVEAKNNIGVTPLTYVKDVDVAKKLLSRVPKDKQKQYIDDSHALQGAVKNKELFAHYLRLGADVTAKNGLGETWVASADGYELGEVLGVLPKAQRKQVFGLPGILNDTIGIHHRSVLPVVAREVPDSELNRPTKEGLTALDYVFNGLEGNVSYPLTAPERDKFKSLKMDLIKRGARPSEGVIKADAAHHPDLLSYLKTVDDADKKTVSVEAPVASDFASMPTLPAAANRGPAVAILVIERQVGDKERVDRHIRQTSYVANGVMQKLLGNKETQSRVIPIAEFSSTEMLGMQRYAVLASEQFKTHAVISHSMGAPDESSASSYSPEAPRQWSRIAEGRRVPMFHSAGNDGDDGRDKQDSASGVLAPSTTNVGATGARYSTRRIEGYSENGAAFAAPTMKYHGAELEGTSFAAPAAAGTYAALYRRYGQWEENRYGLMPEEVKFVMSASANPNFDTTFLEKDKKIPRPDGWQVRKKAGFGELDPLAADQLAAKLFQYKEQHKINDTFITSQVALPEQNTPALPDKDGKYRREFTIDRNIVVDNLLLNLDLKKDKGNAEQRVDGFVEYQGSRIPINFSAEGQSIVAGLNGLQLPKGAKLTLITDTPVRQGTAFLTGFDGDRAEHITAVKTDVAKIKKLKELVSTIDKGYYPGDMGLWVNDGVLDVKELGQLAVTKDPKEVAALRNAILKAADQLGNGDGKFDDADLQKLIAADPKLAAAVKVVADMPTTPAQPGLPKRPGTGPGGPG